MFSSIFLFQLHNVLTFVFSFQNLLMKISEHRIEHWNEEGNPSNCSNSAQVSRSIQMLAQKYCNDCKTTFEELSRVIQVMREILVSHARKLNVKDENVSLLVVPENIDLS